MKKLCGTLFMLLLLCGTAFSAETPKGDAAASSPATRIRIVFGGGETVVSLFDNPQARDFSALLPLDVALDDFSNTEKIFYPPKKLDIKGGENAEEREGDFCYYAPWGNIAVFYKGMGSGTSLYVLGRIEKGKELLSREENRFPARIEVVE